MNIGFFARKQLQVTEDEMTSVAQIFELHLKSAFDTTSTLAILALSFIILLFAWKYRKSLKHFFGYEKRTISLQRGDRQPIPEENEERNCSQVYIS